MKRILTENEKLARAIKMSQLLEEFKSFCMDQVVQCNDYEHKDQLDLLADFTNTFIDFYKIQKE